MASISVNAVAACVDRMYRAGAAHRVGAEIRPLARGWARLRPGVKEEAYASTAFNRVHWYTPETPLTSFDIEEADSMLRDAGVPHAFFWCSERAVSGDGEREVQRIATEVTDVKYYVLARSLDAPLPEPRSDFRARHVPADELPAALDQIAPWYGAGGAPAAISMARAGLAEFFGAFDGDTPVALSALLFDRAKSTVHGYLGWTGTSPDHRGRGAQSAMIAARLARAAQVGCDWCVSETNTAVETSLRNLRRLSFEVRATWRVFKWTRG